MQVSTVYQLNVTLGSFRDNFERTCREGGATGRAIFCEINRRGSSVIRPALL